jgi:dolichyl-phosphate beta-glucosyltransferase
VLEHNPAPGVDLSVVIPAHNEATRILPHLRSIAEYLSSQRRSYEIIVVDDGSLDETATVVREYAGHQSSVRLIQLPTCVGKGGAVRHGMLTAKGRLQLFTDADGATAITELARLEQAVASGADVAIGSRSLASRLPGYTIHASLYRIILGNLFNSVVQHSGIRGITDTQCGFKLFRQAVATDLFRVSSINGYGFDLELLYVAQQRGYRIVEIPVNWSDQPGSKVRVLRDGLAMLYELAVIRRNGTKGTYSAPSPARNFHPVTASQVGTLRNK